MGILLQCRLNDREIGPRWSLDEPNTTTLGPSETLIFRQVAPHHCFPSRCHGMAMKFRYAWAEMASLTRLDMDPGVGVVLFGRVDPDRRDG